MATRKYATLVNVEKQFEFTRPSIEIYTARAEDSGRRQAKPIFEPWDTIPKMPNNLPATRTIARRGPTGACQNVLYTSI